MKNKNIALEMIRSGRLRALEDGTILCKVAEIERPKKLAIINEYYRFNTSWKSKRYNFLAHQIIWLQFNPQSEMSGMTINHKDGNKLNNSIHNLELITPKQNTNHALDLGLSDRYRNAGDKCATAKLTWPNALMIKALKDVLPMKEIAIMFGVSQGNVSNIVNDKRFKLEHCPAEYRLDEIYEFAKYKVMYCDTLNKNFAARAKI